MKPPLPLLSSVEAFFTRHGLTGRAGLIAVSGGPDSVALAHLLGTLQGACFFPRLVLGHVNHQLRGPDSDADETFVRGLADKLKMPCRTVQIDVAALSRTGKDNLENSARQARYDWLTRVAVQEDAGWVAVGHSADDQAETILFRLLRGSGLHGLAGMRERRTLAPGIDLVRPLLDIRRSDLLTYLQEQGQPYCIDASNLDVRNARNRIRHRLIPLLEAEYQPALVPLLARLSQQCRDVQDLLMGQASAWLAEAELPRAGPLVILHLDRLACAPRHLQREVARLIWQREDWPQNAMTFEHWDRFAGLVCGEAAACDLPDGVTLRRVGRMLQLGGPQKKTGY